MLELIKLTKVTGRDDWNIEASDQEFNILVSVGPANNSVRYQKTIVAAELTTTSQTYSIDAHNPGQIDRNRAQALLLDFSVNSERTLLFVRGLSNFSPSSKSIVAIYALREIEDTGGDEGTTVVANPATDPADPTLDSVTIGSEDYRIVGQQQPPDPLTEQKILDAIPSSPLDGQVLTFDESTGNLIWTTPSSSESTTKETISVGPAPNYQALYYALEEAIFAGTTKLQYSGKNVEYRSLDEMIKIHRMLARKLGMRSAKPRVATITYKNRSYH